MRMANRWTVHIGKDGKIEAIDKDVKPGSSAEGGSTAHSLGVSAHQR
jgi:hypothetical protein